MIFMQQIYYFSHKCRIPYAVSGINLLLYLIIFVYTLAGFLVIEELELGCIEIVILTLVLD